MPNPNAAKKTASAPKKRINPTLLLAVVLFVAVVTAAVTGFAAVKSTEVTLRTNNQTYTLEVAKTQAQKELGLGGHHLSMAANHGMLFPYATPGNYCYWMKGMHFSLDIIWLDSAKRVIKIEPNLSPQTYPKTYCPSDANAQYVIELNAGQAAAARIRPGQQLQF